MAGGPPLKIDLKGIHKVSRSLASGATKVHVYAWRGGPKMQSEPGTPAFLAEFAALTAERDRPQHYKDTLQALINAYQQDPDFVQLKEVTKKGYIQRIRRIEAEFGDMPIKVLNDFRVRKDFLAWRTKVAKDSGTREADYRITVLARILSWAHHHRKISENHLKDPKRIHNGSRVEFIWTDEKIAQFRTTAPLHLDLPFTLGLETGQRELDILTLRWSNWDGSCLRLKQSKSGQYLTIPIMAETRERLNRLREGRQPTDHICLTLNGTPWTPDGFKSSFGKAKSKAEIGNLTFHDTRGTAVVNLARAGSSVAEIASITGHSLRDAENILSKHYLAADRELAESAMRKMETYRAKKRNEAAAKKTVV
jgi:integrase